MLQSKMSGMFFWNTVYIARVEVAKPDNAAQDMHWKVFQNTKKVQQLLPQFASTYAMVNLKEVSVAGFQHIYSNAACGCRVLVPIRTGHYQAIGLKEAYGSDSDVQNVVHCLASLPLIRSLYSRVSQQQQQRRRRRSLSVVHVSSDDVNIRSLILCFYWIQAVRRLLYRMPLQVYDGDVWHFRNGTLAFYCWVGVHYVKS